MNSKIGIMKESSLHASLKNWYAENDGMLEKKMNQYHIDIVKNGELIEIQTGNFSNIKGKLQSLLSEFSVRLVYPVANKRWIVRIDRDGNLISRRKSPKKGQYLDIFNELIYIFPYIENKNFVLEIILLNDELVYIEDGKGSWRRKGWSIFDRVLLEVIEKKSFGNPSDFMNLLPKDLPDKFTTRQMAESCKIRSRLAQRIVYSLFHMGEINRVGKDKNAWVYERNNFGST